MAVDLQGADKASVYADATEDTFCTVVDRGNELSYLFGYKAVPNGVLADPEGGILYARYGGFAVGDQDTITKMEAALRGEAVGQGAAAPLSSPISETNAVRARELLRAGAERFDSDRDVAMDLWKQALRLDPNNYTIRKQVWAVEHPERFYPTIDWDWQTAQTRTERRAER